MTKLRWKTFKSYDAKINKGRFSNVFRLADKIPGDADAFVPITVHAQLSKDEWEETRDWAEPPLAILAVKESFIADYVKRAGYPSLDAFFKEYTYGFIEGLQKRAEHESALAFAYRPGLTQKYQFPAGNMPKGAGQALQEFMAMESAYARILAMLPDHPSIESEFWTNGEDIIAPNIDAANVIADFLESVGVDCPITGSFDIEEDTRNGEVDQLTGYAYISG